MDVLPCCRCFYLLLISLCSTLWAQTETRVVVDLSTATARRPVVLVSYYPAAMEEKTAVFVIPQTRFGGYKSQGNFLKNPAAYDRQGQPLPTRTTNEGIHITNADRLYRLTYEVEAAKSPNNAYQAHLPRIVPGEVFVVNFNYYGYFKGQEKKPYRLEVRKPAALYGATSLLNLQRTNSLNSFRATDYSQLFEQPVLYARPDTISFLHGQTRFSIACYTNRATSAPAICTT